MCLLALHTAFVDIAKRKEFRLRKSLHPSYCLAELIIYDPTHLNVLQISQNVNPLVDFFSGKVLFCTYFLSNVIIM